MILPLHRRRRERGFMLLEILVVIALLAAFALVASRLFTWSMRVIRESPEAETQILRFDSMLIALRNDAWSAEQIVVTDQRTVRITTPQRPVIRWHIADDGAITRSTEADSVDRVWPEIGQRVAFEPHEGGLILLTRDARSQPSDRIILPSELKLIRRDAK